MDWIDERDPFESIVREFFGEARPKRRSVIRSEEDNRSIDFIETKDHAFFIIELPGFSEEDVAVKIRDGAIDLVARKKILEGVHEYLRDKLGEGLRLKRELPRFIQSKDFTQTMRNGILELRFERR